MNKDIKTEICNAVMKKVTAVYKWVFVACMALLTVLMILSIITKQYYLLFNQGAFTLGFISTSILFLKCLKHKIMEMLNEKD